MVRRSDSESGRGHSSSWSRRWPIPVAAAGLVVAAVMAGVASGGYASARPSQSAGQRWHTGPRDSALAVQVACGLIQSLPPSTRSECRLETYRETPSQYVLRVRQFVAPGADQPAFALSEVRLTKDGADATIDRLPTP